MSINMVSFSVVSLMAMVPDRECSIPTLIVSAALAGLPTNAEMAITPAPMIEKNFDDIMSSTRLREFTAGMACKVEAKYKK
jgi:hypothetical protein